MSVIIITGYGGFCKKDDKNKDTIAGSSAPAPITVKQAMTDPNGEAYFTDNSTGAPVIIKPQDSDTLLPLAGISVTFYDGDGSEIFMLSDPTKNYLPSMGVYTSNSEHIIKMGKVSGGAYPGTYYVARIDDEERGSALWSWENANHMGHKDITYIKTINYNETQEIYERTETIIKVCWIVTGKVVTWLFGINIPFSPVDLINTIAPEDPNPPQRWDMYTTQESGGTSYTHLIPSNVPEVSITSLTVDGANISVLWQGTDRTTYPDDLYYTKPVPDREDLTVALGPTGNPDIMYSYRITNTSTGNVYFDWTTWELSKISVEIFSIPYGNYRFEVKAQDEVENVSNIELQNFSVTTETISTSNQPTGITSGDIGTSYDYSTGGSSSNLEHTVQYQFDWKGDGTDLSVWGSATQSKTWFSGGTYSVRARARCTTHTTVVSDWSSGLSVTISSPPAVDDYVWVANWGNGTGNTVTRIKKSDLSTTAITVGTGPFGIAVDETYCWVTNNNSNNVTRITKSTLATTNITVGGNPNGIAVDQTYCWVANKGSNNVTRITKSTLATTNITVGSYPVGIAVDATYVWVANWGSDNVTRIKKSDLTTTQIGVGSNPEGVAVDETYVWVINVVSVGTVTRIKKSDLTTNQIAVGSWPMGVAVDETYCWVTNGNSNNVTRIKKSDLSTTTIAVGTWPYGIAVDTTYVWVANANSNNVTRITKSNSATTNITVGTVPDSIGDMTGYAYDNYSNQ
jgi:YVTN family beta-propeller protein